jgi:hypothetical protein
MAKTGICSVCGASGIIEEHHIIKRSQSKALKNCELNLINLCIDCHKGTYGVHGKHGHKLDVKLKKELQEKLINTISENDILDNETVFEGIGRILEIPTEEVTRACKTLHSEGGIYYMEDVVRALQGERLY